MKIAIVTEEFAGINRSGGIGACANGLYRLLVSEGYDVDVLMTARRDPIFRRSPSVQHIRERYISEEMNNSNYNIDDAISKAYQVYDYIKDKSYDIIHFNDWLGHGYFVCMARRQGHIKSLIITHAHGSSEWVRLNSGRFPNLADLEIEAIEKGQLENSDLVISPSQYLLNWYKSRNISIGRSEVINWLLPQWFAMDYSGSLKTRSVEPGINEVIYYGRHEKRKGFDLFVRALASSPQFRSLNITFLGRFDKIEFENTGSLALRILERHEGGIKFHHDFTQEQTLKYIASRINAICVMPSVTENSPCVVGECFTAGVPFIATRQGGTPELVDPAYHNIALFEHSIPALEGKLLEILRNGLPSLGSTLDPDAIRQKWMRLHTELRSRVEATDAACPPREPLCKVSVCLVHFERPDLLRRAIAALEHQTYENFEVILVDDGSKSERARIALKLIEQEVYKFPLKVLYSDNRYLGAARNLAASKATGEWLLFHDDDNIAEPHEIETFVKSAVVGRFDVLTCQALIFTDEEGPDAAQIKYFPIGIGGTFSLFRNRFGDANALVRRSCFEEVGGFTECYGVGYEDWEFFLKAHLKGYSLGIVPDCLFRYRASADGMLSSGSSVDNMLRIVAGAADAAASFNSELHQLAIRDQVSQEVLDRTWCRLGLQPERDIHRELTAMEPNSQDARRKLIRLMIRTGRLSDAAMNAATLGCLDEEDMSLILAASSRFAADTGLVRQEAHLSAGAQGVIVRGWTADFLPREAVRFLKIDGEVYRINGWAAEHRPDVNAHLKVEGDLMLGFTAVAARATVGSADPLVANLESTSTRVRLQIHGAGIGAPVRGHFDSVMDGRIMPLSDLLDIGGDLKSHIDLHEITGDAYLFTSSSYLHMNGRPSRVKYDLPRDDLGYVLADEMKSIFLFTARGTELRLYFYQARIRDLRAAS